MEEGLFVNFVQTSDNGKTKTWSVQSRLDKSVLAHIKWFGRWRKYCFFPTAETVFDTTCLNEISVFIANEMAKWRAS